ncbi:serine racemase VanT catalytic subunit [Listeria booriae]|uniref:Alanine racemase n=1 Tax=Listeria booriae TaxID=1552123 RepID=A0A842FKN4_9LIST|nr:serine racemase VanT catalytic subunit [Listeria booriae]MBC2283539.1 serine racemase VanT catalytic subunit [Listeria booriae]MBC2293048.1 serine racemase VanT catalytic subunit [Listeria booriae]
MLKTRSYQSLVPCYLWVNALLRTIKQYRKPRRAWRECSRDALIHNAKIIQENLPGKTALMAVVKADAYGHGATYCSQLLEKNGVTIFAVATLDEAIELRKSGIRSDILIFGYTAPSDADKIQHFDLIQTIISEQHGFALEETGMRIRCHLKIDTGMHRTGISRDQMESIIHFYKSDILAVEGIYSHLGSADSLDDEAVERTQAQIEAYDGLLAALQKAGINPQKTHLQSSYGMQNYDNLQYDYVRIGISLYGCQSDYSELTLPLQPVLSLKSRIALIEYVAEDDFIGYGNDVMAPHKMKIAMIPIGYADGIPRNLSSTNLRVSVNGVAVPIIGRICMDMMMLDITDLQEVSVGTEVAIIDSQDAHFSAEVLAEKAETITNEILSRLGKRLPVIYK